MECKICNNLLKRNQSTYCSRECQYKDYKRVKTQRIERHCLLCGSTFLIKESRLNIKNAGKYCSRVCKDSHQKITYLGDKNGMYGKKHSEEHKKHISEIFKNLWKDLEFREKVKRSISDYVKIHGHYPGSDKNSREKAKFTNYKKYGIYHNWNGKYGERKCDKIFIANHDGQTSYEYMVHALTQLKKSKPEALFEAMLIDLNIPYVFQYKYKNRHFDFFIPDYNIVIEIDGDFFHGKDVNFENMKDIQKKTYKNDRYKDSIIKKSNHRFIRLWESDLYKMEIEEIKKVICEK